MTADLGWRAVRVPTEDPGFVVLPTEVLQGESELLDGLEGSDPQDLLLDGAHEALGDAVAFRSAHEARAGFDAEPADLGLKVVAHVLAAVVVSQRQAGGHAARQRAEDFSDALKDRLESLEAGSGLGRVDAHALA